MAQSERGNVTPPPRTPSNGQRARDDVRMWGYHLDEAARYAKKRGIATMQEFLNFWSPRTPDLDPGIDSSPCPFPEEIRRPFYMQPPLGISQELMDRVKSKLNLL